MGCQSSRTREEAVQPLPVADDTAKFLQLANVQNHPVAEALLREWNIFVDAQAKKVAGDPSACQRLEQRPHELWANIESSRVTHSSVDYVGKLFLEYIKGDLSKRGWAGNFDYRVAGVAKQGFIRASATVEVAYGDVSEVVEWEVKIHYHSSGAS